VGGKHHDAALWGLINLVHKYRSARFQGANHVLVVNDLLSDIDRSPVVIQGLLDCNNCPVNPGAVSPRGSQ
jgi:hypothetical protein